MNRTIHLLFLSFSLIIFSFRVQAQNVIVNGSSNSGLISYLTSNNIAYSSNVSTTAAISSADLIFWVGNNSYAGANNDLKTFVQNGGVLVISGDCNLSNNIAASSLLNFTFSSNVGFLDVTVPGSTPNFCSVSATANRGALCNDFNTACSRLTYDSLIFPQLTQGINSLTYNSAKSIAGLSSLISVEYKPALDSNLSNPLNILTTMTYGSGLIIITGDANIYNSSLNDQLFANIINYALVDSEDPVARAKNLTLALDSNGQAMLSPSQLDSGSTDNVGITALTLSQNTFDCNDVGNNMVILTATDAASNSASDTAIVTIADDLPPQVFTKSLSLQLNSSGNASITAADLDDGSFDNCGIASMAIDKNSFNCADAGSTFQVQLTITDQNGLSASAFARVNVSDSNLPDNDNDNISDVCDPDDDNDGIPDNIDEYPLDKNNNGKSVIVTYVWDDLNGDGIQDANEPPVAGMKVKLYGLFFQYLGQTTTDSSGLAAFFDLNQNAKVRLKYMKNKGQAFTYRNKGRDHDLDSDVNQIFGISQLVNVKNKQLISNIDAGIWSEGAIDAYVWHDQDGDGIQDSTEVPMAGVQVELLSWTNRTIDQVLTDSMGIAHFEGVSAGALRKLKFVAPSGFGFTLKDRGNDYTLDSDAHPNHGKTKLFIIRSGAELITNIDAGLVAVAPQPRLATTDEVEEEIIEEEIVDVAESETEEEILNEFDLLLYPNPVRTDFNLKVSSSVQEQAVIMIFDLMGKKAMEKTIMLQKGENTFNIDFSTGDLSSGNYILTVYPNSQPVKSVKFIKE